MSTPRTAEEEIQYLRGLLEGSEVQARTLHVVIARLLDERKSRAWDKDVRAALAIVTPLLPVSGGVNIDRIPEMAMKWADEIQKGREERAKRGTAEGLVAVGGKA